MLPSATIPRSLQALLEEFRPCFTAPTFATFCGLLTGLIAQTRRRTVCGMLLGGGLERIWHHSRAHRFFAAARWSPDRVGLLLCDLIVRLLLPAGAPITLAVDDTLFKRAGKKVYGAFWHHDGAAKGPKPIGYGNCWVVARRHRRPALPAPARVPAAAGPPLVPQGHREDRARPRHGRTDRHPLPGPGRTRGRRRRVHQRTPAGTEREHHLDLTAESHLSALPAAPAAHREGRAAQDQRPAAGHPRRPGQGRDLAQSTVRRYGRTDTVQIAEVLCIWFGVLHTQLLRVILVRDDKPRTRDKDERGYGLPLVTTDLTTTAEDLVARYASRWSIEPVFFGARRILGVGEARNRLRNAVQRTVPFGLIAYSLTVLWYTRHGHDPEQITEQRTRSRWYTTKTEPSFEDMVIKLRRVIIATRFQHPGPYQPQPEETRAVLLAWAAAET